MLDFSNTPPKRQLPAHLKPDPLTTVPIPRRVYIRQNVEFARWSCTAGCSSCMAAWCREIETAWRADEELETRVPKVDIARNVHHKGR